MRIRELNFALAIAGSVTVHALLWPASMHIFIPAGVDSSRQGRTGEVTLLLNEPNLPPTPKLPDVVPLEEIGEATGKGTGSQSSKGDRPMTAREADQDQPSLSHDAEKSHAGEHPSLYTGPRGQDGTGGQRGG